ncbi:MAG TPA: glycosyltransferase, partial [bacterium]|nr:glycosyltransferase [bacterium]
MINQVNDMDSTRMNDGQTAERRSFSIVVPCYNAEKTLAACLKSFLDSGYPGDKLELIVAGPRGRNRRLIL